MHILHYLRAIRLRDGGVVRAVLDMCTYQARAGCTVTLATCDAADAPDAWKCGTPGVPRVVDVGPPPCAVLPPLRFRARLEPLVRAADVLHLHVIWDSSQLAIASLGRSHGKPYIQSPHGMLADWSVSQKRLKKWVFWSLWGRRFIDGARFVLLTAQGELDQTAKRHPRTAGVVIPLIFDLDPFRNAPTPELARRSLPLPPAHMTTVLYLSRLHYKKRPDLLLAAARAARDQGGAFHLVFAGPCEAEYERQLRTYAQSLGVDDMTTFLGMVPEAVKPSLYAACDLFVLPTSMENFGFVYFEALASGLPVLTTRGTDTWRELEASGGGRIVDMIRSNVQDGQVGGGDVRQLAEALSGMISDREQLRAMGRRGRQWVLKHMDPDVVVTRYLSTYRDASTRA